MATDMANANSKAASALNAGPESPPRSMREEIRKPLRKKPVISEEAAIDGSQSAQARLDRRFNSLQTTISEIADVVERHEISLREREDAFAAIADSVLVLCTRMDELEKREAVETAELRTALAAVTERLAALEAERAGNPAQAYPAPHSVVQPAAAELPPVWTGETEPVPDDSKNAPRESAIAAKASESQSYLVAARRAAIAGTASKDKAPGMGTAEPSRRFGRTQFAIVGLAAPLMVVAAASFVLSRHSVQAEPMPKVAVARPLPALPVSPSAGMSPPPELVAAPPADPASNDLASAMPVAELEAKAAAGDSAAERDIGLEYLAGNRVEGNDEEAARWLLSASYRGESTAEYWLGTLYARGRGVPVNISQANHWYEASARQGNPNAMHRLALANFSGLGMDNNAAEAARWFGQAAELGLSDSQFDLAVLYERGVGVKQSLTAAYKWYSAAAAQGDKAAMSRVEALSKMLKPEDLASAARLATEAKPE